VIASGETHSVREFIEKTFDVFHMPIEWQGNGIQEEGIDSKTGKVRVRIDPKYFRPTEVDLLQGNPSKAKKVLGWKPTVGFSELVTIMAKADGNVE